MRILALGGTQFVGRAFVEAAAAQGHEVTVLHRGKSPLPDGLNVNEVLADRDGGLDVLGQQSWDAVYDSCGYVPRIVKQSLDALADRCGRYLFISTISVYDEDLNIRRPEKPLETEVLNNDSYGPLKVECEDALSERLGDRLTIVRPGLVAGPFDHTWRFPYWVDRLARFGEVLTPEMLGVPLQQIDARDLGAFCVRLLEDDRAVTLEAAGEHSTFGAMIQACAAAGGGTPVLVPPQIIEAHGISVGGDLPLAYEDRGLMLKFDCKEALAAGLTRRSLRETTADTLAWVLTVPEEKRAKEFLSREKEEAVLKEVLV